MSISLIRCESPSLETNTGCGIGDATGDAGGGNGLDGVAGDVAGAATGAGAGAEYLNVRRRIPGTDVLPVGLDGPNSNSANRTRFWEAS